MLPGVEGGVTKHIPSGEILPIWDAAERYVQEGTPLIILAGKEYGSGSSRDWGGPRPQLQGVRAVIAESFWSASTAATWWVWACCRWSSCWARRRRPLGLTGYETVDILGLDEMTPGQRYTVRCRG